MKTKIILIVLLVILSSLLQAQIPSLDADPKAYTYAKIEQSENWRNYMEAALWASGVSPANMKKYFIKMENLLAEINTGIAEIPPEDIYDRGEYLLRHLHQKTLKTYSENNTRLDDIFLKGTYNCVSSSVLYLICAIAAGMDAEGAKSEDHAFVLLKNGNERIDVQTTNKNGFDYTAPEYEIREVISKTELVSLILHNRIAQLEKQNRYAEVIPLAVNREAFLSHVDAPNDLNQKLLNLAIHYFKSKKYDNVIALAMLAEYEDYSGEWEEVLFTSAYNKIAGIIRTNKPLAEAESILKKIESKLEFSRYAEIKNMILDAQAVEMVSKITTKGNADEVLAFLEEIKESIPEQRWKNMVTITIVSGMNRFGSDEANDALIWINKAIEKYGSNKSFEQIQQNYMIMLQLD